jgi:hypothetical protein
LIPFLDRNDSVKTTVCQSIQNYSRILSKFQQCQISKILERVGAAASHAGDVDASPNFGYVTPL